MGRTYLVLLASAFVALLLAARAVAAAAAVRETIHWNPVGDPLNPSEVETDLRESALSVWSEEGSGCLYYSGGWPPMAVYRCPARLA